MSPRVWTGEVKHFVSHPYYIVNSVLSMAFVLLRKVSPFCDVLFADAHRDSKVDETCQFDMRESEILFFLMIIIMVKARKNGVTTAVSYISSGFIYAKLANVVLFFRADPRYGVLYFILFALQAVLLPEPTYKGPEFVTYFRANGLDEELERNRRCTWLVTFYTAWSPLSVKFAPLFAKLSANYHLDNLKFGKIDVGRYPEVATKYGIDTSTLSSQLPTVILFKGGIEICRLPTVGPTTAAVASQRKHFSRLLLSETDFVQLFDLASVYAKCSHVSSSASHKSTPVSDVTANTDDDNDDPVATKKNL